MIKAIAADAGFLDYQHFCRTFKKRMGVSRPNTGVRKIRQLLPENK